MIRRSEHLPNTYSLDRGEVSVEVGDSKQHDFVPQVKLMRWDNEVNFSVRYEGETQDYADVGGGVLVTKNTRIYEREPKALEPEKKIAPNRARIVDAGRVKPTGFPALYQMHRDLDTKHPVVSHWVSDGIGFAYWGSVDARKDLYVDELPYPISRAPLKKHSSCPVIYMNNIFVVDVYWPGHQISLDTVLSAYNKALSKYGVSIERSNNFSGHLLVYRKGLRKVRVGRMDFEDDHVTTLFFLDNPVTDELIQYVKPGARLRDTKMFPIGGLRDLNPEIEDSLAGDVAHELARLAGLRARKTPLLPAEQQKYVELESVYADKSYQVEGIVGRPLPYDEKKPNLELEIILDDRPDSNVFELSIQSKGLDFYYQPELTEREVEEGMIRPPHVVGSYAVYHSTKKNNKYKTGKAFHIYRPQAIDNNGAWTWADINISNGKMTITVPQNFLDNAIYPVTIDPTFGYDEQGATYAEIIPRRAQGSVFTAPEDGELKSLSVYVEGMETIERRLAVYNPSDGSLHSQSDVSDDSWSTGWHTLNLSGAIEKSSDYILTPVHNGGEKAFVLFYFDTGAANQGVRGESFDVEDWPTLSDPDNFTFYSNNKFSIYATYGPPGGTVKYYNGTEWVDKPLKAYDGSGWQNTIPKTYDGSDWQ